jgi:hypothetical protein
MSPARTRELELASIGHEAPDDFSLGRVSDSVLNFESARAS